jgi:hypothetical protein
MPTKNLVSETRRDAGKISITKGSGKDRAAWLPQAK